jgi:IclR family transcriptional regulator, acetate operon repressor
MRSSATTLSVFEAIADQQPVGLSALARWLDVPKPTVQRSLLVLGEAGWIVQDLLGAGTWTVAARFAVLTEAAPLVQAVRALVRPHLPSLSERVGGRVALYTIDGDRMALLDGFEGTRVLRAVEARLGPLPIHASGAGRAMLAALPVARRQEVVQHLARRGLTRYTARTVTDPDELDARIGEARTLGYAVLDREYVDDVATVGAAIVGPDGMPVAGLAITALITQLRPKVRPQVGKELAATAAQVATALRSASG